MSLPQEGGKLTKVIISEYPVILDSNFLLDRQRSHICSGAQKGVAVRGAACYAPGAADGDTSCGPVSKIAL